MYICFIEFVVFLNLFFLLFYRAGIFMKNIIILLCVLGFSFSQVNAQQWVSKQPEKRNVILEEFTGIHCGFCPDGHRIANDLVKANEGRIFLINIHSGSFATPNTGELDLRTTIGNAIDAASGVTGYPAGSVNRSTNPWAKNRGEWAGFATTILNQTSPVNVAAKAYVDFTTRELVTEVEIYYTSNSAVSTNYLTVMLTQDNILGTQSDGGNFNPTNWTADKKYRHNHVLRQAITSGQAWGEKIDTTTAGHFEYRKYTTKLPETLLNTDVVLYNLDVVAFVSETKNNILSGVGVPVDFDTSVRIDLGIKDLTVYPTNYCFTKINPKIEVTNNSGISITSFDISAYLNGTENKKSFSGDLPKDGKTIIDWGEMPFTTIGPYIVSFQGLKNLNGNTIEDMDFSNDAASYSGLGFKSKAFGNYNGKFDGLLPSNTAFDASQNNCFNIVSSSSPKYGANNTNGAVRFKLDSSWVMSGKPGHIIFGEADLTKITSPYLDYFYAYSDGSAGGSPPTIKVSVSDDCGASWKEINSVVCKETGQPAVAGNWYVPTSSQYKLVEISIAEYINKSVMFRVTGIPGTAGNALYIDEISVGTQVSDVEEEIAASDFSVYPNPASSEVRFNNDKFSDAEYSIYSVLGETLSFGTITNNSININNLAPGFYYIKINNEVLKFIKK
jgi:hypothetical protein